MSQFNNFQNVPVATSGCGVNNLPGVAVYQPSVECPGAGVGASTFQSPALPIGVSLTQPIPRLTFASSTAARNVIIGPFDETCLSFLSTELGVTVVDAFDAASALNNAARVLDCFLEARQGIIGGLIVKSSSADLSGLTATQVTFNPCSPCVTSDTDFLCNNGCNGFSNYILSNFVAGGPNAIIINIPASVALTIDVCSCAPQVNSYAGCPAQYPAIAAVPTGPACPPAGFNPYGTR